MILPATDVHLSIFTRLTEARADWQQLKDAGCGNPYQTLDWLEAWLETLGRTRNVSPRIVVGHLAGTPVLWLPFGLERSAGVRILSFLGNQHGNQNTGIWDRDYYEAVSASAIASLLRVVCSKAGADVLILDNVPRNWHGRTHPLVLENATPSSSPVFARRLGNDFDQLFRDTHRKSSRKNLLRKERHLQAAGNFRVARAETEAERRRGLEAFLEQRAARSLEAGIPNVFDTPAAGNFLRRLLGLGEPDGIFRDPPMDLWYLETGGDIRSTYLCLERNGTLYAYSNSISHDDMLANSPGLVLIKEIIARACARPDLKTLDLGLGEERYKTGWTEPVPLSDSLLAVSFRGLLFQGFSSQRLKVKSAIRNSAVLWPLVRRLRKWKAGLRKGSIPKS